MARVSSELTKRKEEAIQKGWERMPDADDVRPQMLPGGEIAVHIWKNGVAHLEFVEVWTDEGL